MDEIEKGISNLGSPNKNTSYEACEELRVADSLPQSALTALEAATWDFDPQVAEAAKRALASHSPIEEHSVNPPDLPFQDTPLEPRKWNPLAIASFILGILSCVFSILILWASYYDLEAAVVLIAAMLIPTVGIVSLVAFHQVQQSGGRQKGIGFAIAGLLLTIISFCLSEIVAFGLSLKENFGFELF